LGFWRRAVDFIRKQDLGENRTLDEGEFALTGAFVFLEDFIAQDVGGHEIGRELDPVEGEMQRIGEAVNQGGLGHAGRSDQEDVPAGEQGDEEMFDQGFVADDDLADFGFDAGEGVGGGSHGGEDRRFYGQRNRRVLIKYRTVV
jgi:hypothetical protein